MNTELIGYGTKQRAGFTPGLLPEREFNLVMPDPGAKKIAITFDDGPNGEKTLRLLEGSQSDVYGGDMSAAFEAAEFS